MTRQFGSARGCMAPYAIALGPMGTGTVGENDRHVVIIGAGFSGIGAAISARPRRPVGLPDRRGGRRRRRHLALEQLSGRRRRHPVVQLPVLVREAHRLVARVRAGRGAARLRRALRRALRAARPASRFGTRVTGGDVRRGRAASGSSRPTTGDDAHRAPRDRRDRRAHPAEAARHRGRRDVRRHDAAHRALGPRRRPARQARRRDRHRRLGGPADPGDRRPRSST